MDTLLVILNFVNRALVHCNGTPMTYNDALTDVNSIYWKKEIDDELNSLEQLGTWTVVDATDLSIPNLLTTKWVFKLKEDDEGNIIKYKARLVAKGYKQQAGIDFFDT